MAAPAAAMSATQKLTQLNESTWLQVGTLAESMNEPERAMNAYESALRHNPHSVQALTQAAALCRAREQYSKAVDYFQRILNIDQTNGEIWGALGHCFLMMDDLQRAYTAYQQALYHLPNPKEPKLWYGIGILYDRYGSYEHAEEAFSAVIRMEPKFEKANEIYFRLGIIYKQQGKYETSLSCFRYILACPPKPLTEIDIWFQIGHVYEQQKEYQLARDAYERVLSENPNHAKVLQQLGWLYHQQNSSFSNQELAIQYLTRSLEADMNDAQTWYLLGRCYMAQQKYNKAYEAYQQAVYRDGRNPTFWCSIGVLYYQINQYRDALDAYSRAIRLNPYISEVWYDLGTLYESCNNQINDALDAYTRALELDPTNPHIKQRLQMLRNAQAGGGQVQVGAAQPQQPAPQDINATGYPGGNAIHPNAPSHFYQGPQPPTQMGYPRSSQQDQRSTHASAPPQTEHDRRDLPSLQMNPPASYPAQPMSQRDEGRNGLVADRQLPPASADHPSRAGRNKQSRPERTTSPKPQTDRRGPAHPRQASRTLAHDALQPSSVPYPSSDDALQRSGRPSEPLGRPPELPSRHLDTPPRPTDIPGRLADQSTNRHFESPSASHSDNARHIADPPRLPDIGSRNVESLSRLPEMQIRPSDHTHLLRPMELSPHAKLDDPPRQQDVPINPMESEVTRNRTDRRSYSVERPSGFTEPTTEIRVSETALKQPQEKFVQSNFPSESSTWQRTRHAKSRSPPVDEQSRNGYQRDMNTESKVRSRDPDPVTRGLHGFESSKDVPSKASSPTVDLEVSKQAERINTTKPSDATRPSQDRVANRETPTERILSAPMKADKAGGENRRTQPERMSVSQLNERGEDRRERDAQIEVRRDDNSKDGSRDRVPMVPSESENDYVVKGKEATREVTIDNDVTEHGRSQSHRGSPSGAVTPPDGLAALASYGNTDSVVEHESPDNPASHYGSSLIERSEPGDMAKGTEQVSGKRPYEKDHSDLRYSPEAKRPKAVDGEEDS
ncbi:hypothetical protein SpCBS45565_g08190 [Spizellomyces sp. 'palustris']|nr:hypothetical protein SpCBS45565_g08190 [Spizellomyces sp. 'palustris']